MLQEKLTCIAVITIWVNLQHLLCGNDKTRLKIVQ